MANRYQELKKENDQTLSYLGDSYQRLADIYVKKARGYAVKNEDTEVKIRNVLTELKELDEKRIPISVSIPNESFYIEEHVKLLSKKYKDPDKIKGIIWLTIIIVASIIWIAVGQYFARPVKFDAPTELKVSRVIDNKVTITWKAVPNAKEYIVYYITKEGTKSAERTISVCEYVFELEYDKEYTFYVYVDQTQAINSSDSTSITYTLKQNQN